MVKAEIHYILFIQVYLENFTNTDWLTPILLLKKLTCIIKADSAHV